MNKVFDGVFGTADHDPKVEWSGHVCHQSGNPRDEGRCACGKALTVLPEADEVRDVLYEEPYLKEAAAQAAKRFGLQNDGWVSTVQHRLELGQRLYGNKFMELDLFKEGGEEGFDGGAYSVLQIEKMMALGLENDDQAYWLFEAAVYAAAMTTCFQRARTA